MYILLKYNANMKGGGTLSPRPIANTERITTFLSPKHLELLKKEAEEKGTNISALIRMIILEHLAQRK